MILFLLAFVAFLIIGIPISVSIGFSAVLGCLSLGYPLVVIGQKMVSGIDSWLLIAIPLFILAGNLMNATFVTGDPELDARFVAEAAKAGFVNLKGHRSVGGMRASIYNAMPIEGVKKLTEFMADFEQKL